jgi:hypothetical protein
MTTAADIARDGMYIIRTTQKAIVDGLMGRMVRVTSDHNGQPFGHSKPSWRGQERRIVDVHVGAHSIELVLEGHEYECFIPAEQVELL